MMLSEDYSGSITSAVRVRPFSQKEIETDGNKLAVDCSNPGKVMCLKTGSQSLSFSVDHVFNDTYPVNLNQSQKEVYEILAVPLLQKSLLGYNACLFAYGVTSSGKTHSMYGTPSNPGIVPRIIEDLFDYIRQKKEPSASFSVKFSYFEIYNEKIYDLLQDKNPAPKLRVREDPLEGPYIQDLVQPVVHSPAEVFDWLRKGDSRRKVAATEMNANSSRSHTIASFHFTKRELASFSKKATVESVIKSKLNLVDLAGSERQSLNNSTGERLVEACQINKSLFTLGRVIYQLSGELSVSSAANSATPLSSKRKTSYVSYRDSLLTWILKDSLGGNSVTTMLATVSPSSLRTEDTISTLQHVIRAQRIVNQAKVNEDPSGVIIRELKAQVEKLQQCRKEASTPDSPLYGQIKNLENLLKTREREVAELARELTERTLDCERLRAEATLRSASIENISQPLFSDDMDPDDLIDTPIKRPRSCDERDSGAYSDISRPLPDGSEKNDLSVQTDTIDKADNVIAIDSLSKTVLDEASTVHSEFHDVSVNTDELFKMVPLGEYEKFLLELEALETYFRVKKIGKSVQAREEDFGFCVLPSGQIEALNDIIKNQSLSADISNEEMNETASSSWNEDHAIPLKEFSQLMEDLYNTQQRIHELEVEKHDRLYNLTDASTNTSADIEVVSSSPLNKFQENVKQLESALPTLANVPKCDVSTCSADLDWKVLSGPEYRLMKDELNAMRSRKYTNAMTSTALQSDISPTSEVENLTKKIETLQKELGFKSIHQRCDMATDCADFDYVFVNRSTMEEITQEFCRLKAIDAKRYVESATLTDTELEVIPTSELKAMRSDLRFLKSQLETYVNVDKREVATCSADLNCKIMDSMVYSQIVDEMNSMRKRLLSIDAKKYVDSMTLTDISSEVIFKSKLANMKERFQSLEPSTNDKKCDMATSSCDLGYEVLSKYIYDSMRNRLAIIDAKKFTDSATLTQEGLTVIPVSELSKLKVQVQALYALMNIRKQDSSTCTTDLDLEIIPRAELEKISSHLETASSRLALIDAKKFINTSAMTEERVEVIPQAEFRAMKEQMRHLDSQLEMLGKIVKLEPFEQNSKSLPARIIENVSQMRERLAEFESRVLVDACTEINDYDLGVTVLSTNYFNELYQRQYRIREKLTCLKSKVLKADTNVSTELEASDCDFETLLGRIDELKAIVEKYQATVDDVEKSLIVEEKSKQEQVAEHDDQSLTDKEITSDTTTNRFLGYVPKRMDDYVLNRVKYFENLQACGSSTVLSRTLKRFRSEEVDDNKENKHPGKRHKATQTKLERMKSTRPEDEMELMQYRMSIQSWNLQYLEKENKQLTTDCKSLVELLTKLIRAYRTTPSSYVISILDDVKKTLNQVSDDMQRDVRAILS